MAGYNDTKELIIRALMGRPEGEEIQPENHQAYALNMLDYIRSLELVSTSTLIGIAESNTVPVQPNDSRVCYIAGVGQDRTVTFSNFIDDEGNPISITTGEMEGVFVILLWNMEHWVAYTFNTNIISSAESANFYYNYNIRKTYASVAAMNADSTNPIGIDGKSIKIGDLVTVVNATTPSENGFYSRTANGWQLQSGFNFQVVQTTGSDVNVAMSQKAITDKLADEVSVYNVTVQIPLETGYYTSAAAKAAVPLNIRKNGLVITYEMSKNNWVLEQFVGDLSIGPLEWDRSYRWKYIYDAKIIHLDWNTDEQTTRLQVPSINRKMGVILFYQNGNGTPVMEQYIKTETSDSYFRNSNNYINIILNNIYILGITPKSFSNNLYDYKGNNTGFKLEYGKVKSGTSEVASKLIIVDSNKSYYINKTGLNIYQFKENGYSLGTANIADNIVTLHPDTKFVVIYFGTSLAKSDPTVMFCELGNESVFVPYLGENENIGIYPNYYNIYEENSNISRILNFQNNKYTNNSFNVVDNANYRTSEKIILFPDTDYSFRSTEIKLFTKDGRYSRTIAGGGGSGSIVTFKTYSYETIGVLNISLSYYKPLFCLGVENISEDIIFKAAGLAENIKEIQIGNTNNFNELYATQEYEGVIKIPANLLSRDELTVEFDFIPNFDIHGFTNKVFDMFTFGKNDTLGQSPTNALKNSGYYSVGVKSIMPISGKFEPDWKSYFNVQWNSYDNKIYVEDRLSAAPHSNYLRNNLNGETSFSIRKINVTADDYGTTLSNYNGILSLKKGDVIIKSYDLADFSDITSLVTQMRVDLPDYEFNIYSGIYPTTRLINFKDVSLVCRNIEYDVPDNFPFYIPLNSIGRKYRFKFTIRKTGSTSFEYMAFVDGMYLVWMKDITTNSTATLDDKFIMIGGKVDGVDNKFDGVIENIVIKNKFEWEKRILLCAAHEPFNDGETLGEGVNISQINYFFENAKKLGWSIISGNEFKKYINGEVSYQELPNKSIALSYDDSRWDVWENEYHRLALMRLGVSPILFIPDSRVGQASENTIRNFTDYGWSYGSHAWQHININKLTYNILKDHISSSKLVYEQYVYPNIYCYPMSSRAFFISKFLRHELGIPVFIAVGARGYYGISLDNVNRTWDFTNLDILSDTFIEFNNVSSNSNGATNWAYE